MRYTTYVGNVSGRVSNLETTLGALPDDGFEEVFSETLWGAIGDLDLIINEQFYSGAYGTHSAIRWWRLNDGSPGWRVE